MFRHVKFVLCLSLLLACGLASGCRTEQQPVASADVQTLAVQPKATMEIKRIVDGDTIILDIQLFDDLWIKDGRMRIVGVDAPELPTEAGKRAKQFTEAWIAQGGVTVELRKDRDKYGRLLGDLRSARGLLSAALLEQGFAKPYKE